MMLKSASTALLIAVSAVASQVQAVALYRSATRNTTEPTGTYADSGWQYQMNIGNFSGTPIGPHAFVMASHIAAGVGHNFTWNSQTYTVTSATTVPGTTDLALLTVNNTFPKFAAVYNQTTDGSFDGKTMVMFGRGTARGNEIRLATAPRPGENTLRGWEWGTFDSVRSWGTNNIVGVTANGTANSNNYIYYFFNATGGTPEEATLTSGDSGGGAFVKAPDGVWKLVSTNSAVEATFRYTQTGSNFDASIFDKGNLWESFDRGLTYQQIGDTVADQPTIGLLNNVTYYANALAPFIPKPGDATLDGKVNTQDFNLFAGHFGESSFNWADGDFNHDGLVNSIDFNLYKANYGFIGTPPAGATLSAASAVPEPATGALVVLAAIAGLRRSRRH